ncbi:Uma2 family endonuclease [Kitasatospora kifunensis]|uniref:Uma2 family endonuclease n=1 Tax=Kitasatospora kifunensis TaxID=58351 RepID=A0A7W7VTX2_KITKI|nr:Uma2 family endonuclease [Kitasatospora kifunensis]MBB4922771.1 Uma2 family endonuclease [Kitasatospora kifunensis]
MSVATADHSGPWTVEDVLALPEDPRNRIELVGGALLMSPNPGIPHQRVSSRLWALLDAAIDAAGAPFEALEAVNVVLPDGLLIPDLVIADAIAADKAGATLGAHDVAVAIEIASPSTRVTDKRLKPSLYAAAGIPHYWRLELDPAPRLYLGRLELGTYTDRLVQVGERTDVTEPFPLDLDPAALLRR